MKTYHLVLLLALGCDAPQLPLYSNSHYENVTKYTVILTGNTPKGTPVSDLHNELDLDRVDTLVDEVESCLDSVAEPTPEQAKAMNCLFPQIRRTVARAQFEVMVPPDWYVSNCTGEQLFECGVNESACDAKGLPHFPGCPCACRATIQDNRTIITVPTMKVFKGELVRLVTGCNNVWREPLSVCALP